MKSKASLDKQAWLVTGAVFILFIYVGQKNLRAASSSGTFDISAFLHVTVVVLLLAVLIASYLLSATGYSLSNHELIIHRPFRNKRIPLTGILSVKRVEPSELRGTIRTFGIGGVFGYTGKFSNKQLGKMYWYITQKKNCLLIKMRNDETSIMISPDDPDFEKNLRSLSKFKV